MHASQPQANCKPIYSQLQANCKPTASQYTVNCKPTASQYTVSLQPPGSSPFVHIAGLDCSRFFWVPIVGRPTFGTQKPRAELGGRIAGGPLHSSISPVGPAQFDQPSWACTVRSAQLGLRTDRSTPYPKPPTLSGCRMSVGRHWAPG